MRVKLVKQELLQLFLLLLLSPPYILHVIIFSLVIINVFFIQNHLDEGTQLIFHFYNPLNITHTHTLKSDKELEEDSLDAEGRRPDGTLVFTHTTEFTSRLQARLTEKVIWKPSLSFSFPSLFFHLTFWLYDFICPWYFLLFAFFVLFMNAADFFSKQSQLFIEYMSFSLSKQPTYRKKNEFLSFFISFYRSWSRLGSVSSWGSSTGSGSSRTASAAWDSDGRWRRRWWWWGLSS